MRARLYGTLLLASAILFGCTREDETPPNPTRLEPNAAAPAAPSAMMAEELGRRYGECWRLFNDRQWDEFGGCFAEHMSSTTEGVPGEQDRAAQVAGGKLFANAFPDGRGETRFTLINGRRVVGVTSFAGTHTGLLVDPAGDIPATGKGVGYLLALDATFDDHNQISKMHETFDMASLMFQLGLSPGPGRAAGAQVAPAGFVIATGEGAEANNVAMHARAYELFNARDPAFDAMMADDIVESSVGDPEDVTGKANLVAKNAMLLKGFSDMKVATDEIFGAGDYTVMRGHIRGTNDGEIAEMGLPKTGKSIDMGVLELIHWDAGLAKRVWVFMNTMEMAQQLGLMGEPAAATDSASGATGSE